MKAVVIIPARYKSSRFPGKPLVKLLGKEMILWVSEVSAEAVGKGNVYVATENQDIVEVVEGAGFSAIMTSGEALTGTDRVAEAAKHIDADIYVNVQGDEPLLDPSDIKRVIEEKAEKPNSVINCFSYVSDREDPNSVNIPKVITSESGYMVYMSRSPLPAYKDVKLKPEEYKKQVCIYAFNKNELDDYLAFGRKSVLEMSEDIEILRFIELKRKVYMIEASPGSHAVDVPEDVAVVEQYLKGN
ncbi:3-deoxy-manno-octulosonate cytidylyltransferase [Saccharospirillum salsuginis]|uniref:3-deoxy-manno-octulosonate cytidylyltransferase n=1 Tax=Saccharospirillum salsuginis TaxID=418750 RepID=A0A918KEK4_9GAMM|nr:3-deoxy-manno-octulosonate cytidylyltransferase [Saccharospirillum salsuginis]GGX60329.1 3-deoxy-manno-octulosonate cytidylyltransferase [Saccharospirillum salsuginis]